MCACLLTSGELATCNHPEMMEMKRKMEMTKMEACLSLVPRLPPCPDFVHYRSNAVHLQSKQFFAVFSSYYPGGKMRCIIHCKVFTYKMCTYIHSERIQFKGFLTPRRQDESLYMNWIVDTNCVPIIHSGAMVR